MGHDFIQPFKASCNVSQTFSATSTPTTINLNYGPQTKQFKLVNNTIVARRSCVINITTSGNVNIAQNQGYVLSGAILLNGVPIPETIINQTIPAPPSTIVVPLSIDAVAIPVNKGDVITISASFIYVGGAGTAGLSSYIPTYTVGSPPTTYSGDGVLIVLTVLKQEKDNC